MADRAAELGRVAGLEFVAPAVEGCWLALDGAAPLGEHLSHSWGLVRPPDRALEGLAAALGARARVEAVGQDAAGTHLEIAVPLRAIYEELVAVAGDLVPTMPIDVEFPSAAQIGSREQTLDAWVQSGRFTKLEFDLRQLLELTGGRMSSALGRLTLRMTVSSSAPPLRVPREAVPITF